MISEIINFTKNQLLDLLDNKRINKRCGMLPTLLQLQQASFKHYRFFQSMHKDKTTNLFIIRIESEENNFISAYELLENYKYNEMHLFDFIGMCFNELCLKKLSVEICDCKTNLLSLYLKMGFEVEGLFKQHILIKSKIRNVYRLALTKESFDKYLKQTLPKILHGQRFKINNGDKYSETRVITQKDIELFAQVSHDYNPIHLDAIYAKNHGFNSTIAHGMLLASFISKILGMDFPGNGSIFLSQELKFIKPIYPDIELIITVKVISIIGKKVTLSTHIEQNKQLSIIGTSTILILVET